MLDLQETRNLEAVEVGDWDCDYESRRVELPFGAERDITGEFLTSEAVLRTRAYGEVHGLAYSFVIVLRALAASEKMIQSLSVHCSDGEKPKTIRCLNLEELAAMAPIHNIVGTLAFAKLRSVSLSVSFRESQYHGYRIILTRAWLAKFPGLAGGLVHFRLISDGWAWHSFGPEGYGDERSFGTLVEHMVRKMNLTRKGELVLELEGTKNGRRVWLLYGRLRGWAWRG